MCPAEPKHRWIRWMVQEGALYLDSLLLPMYILLPSSFSERKLKWLRKMVTKCSSGSQTLCLVGRHRKIKTWESLHFIQLPEMAVAILAANLNHAPQNNNHQENVNYCPISLSVKTQEARQYEISKVLNKGKQWQHWTLPPWKRSKDNILD